MQGPAGGVGQDSQGYAGKNNLNNRGMDINLGLYDEDGDLVVLSDSIPLDSVFTVSQLSVKLLGPYNGCPE